MEPSLEHFPPWIQTVAYIATAAIGLGVASHGYFKAWIKKLTPAKAAEAAEGDAKVVSSLMVIDAVAVRMLGDALVRVDATLRSIQDDMRRGHDKEDRTHDSMEELIDLLKLVQNGQQRETMKGPDRD